MAIRSFPAILALSFSLSCVGSQLTAQDFTIIEKARDVIGNRCVECHGALSPSGEFNILDSAGLRKTSPTYKRPYVDIGSPEDSLILHLIDALENENRMPEGGQALPANERDAILQWIKIGAPPFPLGKARPVVSNVDVYQAIETDLSQHNVSTQRTLRYFTIHHLHNNPTISNADLRRFRAALSKLANSLSWERDIHVPIAVDKQKTVFRINLVNLGWHKRNGQKSNWEKLLRKYPYALRFENDANPVLSRTSKDSMRLANTKHPVLRADWFIVRAATAPLYDELLGLPNTAAELEDRLGVDFEQDFNLNKYKRAVFTTSGVSNHNRAVDRFPSKYGAYYKSYDFGTSVGRGNLVAFPLGPDFPRNPFPAMAFVPNGGEIIFNLPNGLQGYMIIDDKGNRIAEAPIGVVFDRNQPIDNKVVINGISCIACHSRGMQPFTDVIGQRLIDYQLFGEGAVNKMSATFPAKARFDVELDRDKARFIDAQKKATQKFLVQGDNLEANEPILSISKRYVKDLTIDDIAAEIGVNAAGVRAMIKNNVGRNIRYRQLIGVLANDVIKREVWEFFGTPDVPYSLFQELATDSRVGVKDRP